jgi:hypothetical protein
VVFKISEYDEIGSHEGLLDMMVYENCKIYGPYSTKDQRLRIVVKFPDGIKRTVSYPKYLMEKHLDRYLALNETVDHIDCDFLNNELSNLRVLIRSDHSYLDVKRRKIENFKCLICNNEFSLDGKKLNDATQNRLKGKTGPFCSKSCAGKYGKLVQLTGQRIPVSKILPSYITIKSQQEP